MPRIERRPLDNLNAEWAVLGRSRASADALASLGAREQAIALLGCTDLGHLVRVMGRGPGNVGRNEAAQLFRYMLRSADAHPLVPRAILPAVAPGLVTVARRLSWGSGGDWDDGGAFFADLTATAWEVIASWAGDDRPYAVLDLLSAVRCRLRRQMVRSRAERQSTAELLDDDGPSTFGGATALDELARSIDELAGRGLDPGDAAVLYGQRVLGLTVAELSELTGRSRRHLDGCRRRAEQRLCA